MADSKSETLQLWIMTLFFTAAGFLIVTLGFTYYASPKKAKEADAAERDYAQLTKLLTTAETKRLRHEFKVNDEKATDEGLRELISENLKTQGLEYDKFPAAKAERATNRAGRAKSVQAVGQKITLKSSPLRPVLSFVGSVAESKKSIRVAALDLSRGRSRADKDSNDSWNASVDFIDYRKAEK